MKRVLAAIAVLSLGGVAQAQWTADPASKRIADAAAAAAAAQATATAMSGKANTLTLNKLAAAPTVAPGVGLGQLFMVAGTNSGTCKLQVIAGTSATPVTIFDNAGAGC